MKKSELKSGMLIVLRSRKRGIVLLNTPQGDVIASNGGAEGEGTWSPLNSYYDDLKYGTSSNYSKEDIVEVWSYPNNMYGVSTSDRDRILLWKREEIKIKTITVKLNKDYDAVITKGEVSIKVGCQLIPIDVINNIVDEYQELHKS